MLSRRFFLIDAIPKMSVLDAEMANHKRIQLFETVAEMMWEQAGLNRDPLPIGSRADAILNRKYYFEALRRSNIP